MRSKLFQAIGQVSGRDQRKTIVIGETSFWVFRKWIGRTIAASNQVGTDDKVARKVVDRLFTYNPIPPICRIGISREGMNHPDDIGCIRI